MGKQNLFLLTTLMVVLFILSCGDDEPTGPTIMAPDAQSISPTEGEIGDEITITITGTGFTGTSITSSDDDLVLGTSTSSETEISVSATISPDAFPKSVSLILTNPEGVDSVSFSLIPASLSGLTWSTLQDIPTPRWGLSVVTVDNKIYAIGGVDAGGNIVATVEIFDPGTNTWTSGTDMSASVLYASSAVIDGKIYIAGGADETTLFSSLNVFDPSTNTWTSLTDMPTARLSAGGTGHNGKIYVAGGADGSSVLDVLESYNPGTSSWTTLATMPSVRENFAMVSYDDKIYAVAGDDGNLRVNLNQFYSPQANTWSTTTSIPTASRYVMSGTFLGNIVVAGGEIFENSTLVTAVSVAVLDPTSNTWSTATDLSDARDTGGMAVIGEKIYIVGGGQYSGNSYSVSASTLVGEIP